MSALQLNGNDSMGYLHVKDQQYTRTMTMQLKVGVFTMRAAFSHIPFWQSAVWMGQQIVMQPCEGNIATGGSVVEQTLQVCVKTYPFVAHELSARRCLNLTMQNCRIQSTEICVT